MAAIPPFLHDRVRRRRRLLLRCRAPRRHPPRPPPLPRTAASPAAPPRPNGRPGADFSTLPPAIAESLARLAGRQTAAPVVRDVAETDAAGSATKPPQG